MNKIKYVEAKYETRIRYDLDDIAERYGFNVDDIISVELGKWTGIQVRLKDGNSFYSSYTPNGDETDWKWAVEESFYGKDYEDLDTDDIKDEMAEAVQEMEDY